MPIVPSRAKEIEELLTGLASADARKRDASVARLTLAGGRAVAPLLSFLDSASPAATLAALTVLERLRPAAALSRLRSLLRHQDLPVAERAIRLLGAFGDARSIKSLSEILSQGPARARIAAVQALHRLHENGVVEALGPLVEAVLDETQAEDVRLGALELLARLPRRDLAEVARQLGPTSSLAIRRRIAVLGAGRSSSTRAIRALLDRLDTVNASQEASLIADIAAAGPAAAEALVQRLERSPLPVALAQRIGRLLASLGPDALDAIHASLKRAASPLALQVLAGAAGQARHPSSIPRLDAALRALAADPAARSDPARAEAAAQLHLALAALGSRIALYDLRERLALRPPIAAGSLLRAAEHIGDASLIPALAALGSEREETRSLCALALAAIVRREQLRRSARILRLVRPEHRGVLAALWPKRVHTPASRRRPA